MRVAWRAGLAVVIVPAAAWAGLFAAACISSAPDASLTPAGAVVKRAVFDGEYCFHAADVRTFQASLDMIDFAGIEGLRDGDVVRVSTSGNRLRIGASEIDLQPPATRWSGGRLLLAPPARDHGARLGLANTFDVREIFLLQDGTLVLRRAAGETGLACGLVPFRDRSEIVIPLRPCGG